MTEKELHKLKRGELLEMMLAQSREIEALRSRISELEKKLADREIRIRESGSIAEAALRLNGVFEAAQAAADQYLENLKKQGSASTTNTEITTNTANTAIAANTEENDRSTNGVEAVEEERKTDR